MILHGDNISSELSADVCLIGAGPAGITIARKLSSAGLKTILCEAGGLEWSSESQDCYQGIKEGDTYLELDTCRLRYYGGTTNHWGGMCRTLEEYNFLPANVDGSLGWPIGKSELDPFLAEAKDILELSSWSNDKPLPGGQLKEIYFSWSKVRVLDKYISFFQSSNACTLILDANFVDADWSSGRIQSAKFLSYSRNRFSVNAKVYVFCCGGIENCRLLLHLNEKYNQEIGNKFRNVGRYWTEHPNYPIGDAVMIKNKNVEGQERYFVPTPEMMRDEKIFDFRLRIIPLHPDKEGSLVRDLLCFAPNIGSRLTQITDHNLVCGARLICEWEQEAVRSNRVELSNEVDHFGMRRIKLVWKKGSIDRRTVRRGAMAFGQYLIDQNLGRVRLVDWLIDDSVSLIKDRLNPSYMVGHHMSGTRMATSEKDGVVDKNCRVFGSENVYIAGSSVFTRGGHVNPTLSIVQLALRLADHLTDQKIQREQDLSSHVGGNTIKVTR